VSTLVAMYQAVRMSFTIRRVDAGSPGFRQLVTVFDEYRTHYGEGPDVPQTAEWLSDQLSDDRLRALTALRDGRTIGFVTGAVLPASLRLATFWLVRDLFVAAAHRRGGAARALLEHLVTEARSAGALRLSLQTEPDNVPALTLYRAAGFRPVEGLANLTLPLTGRL
jgi:GNAT superfamily N-acetyltransferase